MPEILLIAINKLGVNLIDTRSKVRTEVCLYFEVNSQGSKSPIDLRDIV